MDGAFASFNDYRQLLRGRSPVVPEAEFGYWAEIATDAINAGTFGNINETTFELYRLEIIRATCALAEFYFTPSVLDEYRGFKSVSVTGHSVTLADKTQVDRDKEERAIIVRHLASTGLLFSGVK